MKLTVCDRSNRPFFIIVSECQSLRSFYVLISLFLMGITFFQQTVFCTSIPNDCEQKPHLEIVDDPKEQQRIVAEERKKESGEREQETVVLLHGMGRSRFSLFILERRLRKAGFKTLRFPYSCLAGNDLDEITDRLHGYVRENVKTARYHLVGHSLGNIIIRNGFKGEYRVGLGRIVMLAPPNHPSKLAGDFSKNPLFKLLCADAGKRLASKAFYQSLPVPEVEFAVIAGSRGQRLTFDEPNDGIVAVRNTKLRGMKAWVLLPHTHTFIMNASDTARYCIHFLQTGIFPEVI